MEKVYTFLLTTKARVGIATASLLGPLAANAQSFNSDITTGGIPTDTTTGLDDTGGFLERLQQVMRNLIPFVLAVGVLLSIIGIVRYIIASDDENKKKGLTLFVWSLVGTVFVLAFWAFVSLIAGTFELDVGGALDPNTIPTL